MRKWICDRQCRRCKARHLCLELRQRCARIEAGKERLIGGRGESEQIVVLTRGNRLVSPAHGEALKKRRIFGEVIDHLSREGIPEDANAAADHCRTAPAKWLPRKAKPRRPFQIC